MARLREQLGDPLLIKVGGAMVPSPFALQLVEDIRPILRSIQRIAALPQHFEPATSERTFRVSVSDFTPSVLPEVMGQDPHGSAARRGRVADARFGNADGDR